MPTYNYRCEEHEVFEKFQRIKDHAAANCPHCGVVCKQVLIDAPSLDVEGMADAGCPGAFHTSGDRITKRHTEAGQSHSYWRN